jgi:hypothetical protein
VAGGSLPLPGRHRCDRGAGSQRGARGIWSLSSAPQRTRSESISLRLAWKKGPRGAVQNFSFGWQELSQKGKTFTHAQSCPGPKLPFRPWEKKKTLQIQGVRWVPNVSPRASPWHIACTLVPRWVVPLHGRGIWAMGEPPRPRPPRNAPR